MMREKLRWIGAVIGISMLLLSLASCSSTSEDEYTNGEGIIINSVEGEGRPPGSVSFGILSTYNEISVSGLDLLLETPQDEIVLTFRGTSNIPIMLKIFYNYEEVAFLVEDTESYVTQFLFELPDDERETNITFRMSSELEVNDTFNSLIIGAFPHPDYFSKNDDHFTITNYLGSVLNYRLSYGGEENLVLAVPYQDFPEQIGRYHRGVMINQDPAELTLTYSDGGVFSMHPNPLQVTPNEVVEFYFYINLQWTDEIETLQNYLLISMLDWQQIEKNGLPYLLFEARLDDMYNDMMDHGRFTVTMPSEPGFYEFVTFAVPDPTHFNEIMMQERLSFSFPFTVEVVEE